MASDVLIGLMGLATSVGHMMYQSGPYILNDPNPANQVPTEAHIQPKCLNHLFPKLEFYFGHV